MSYATAERDIEKRLLANWGTTVIDINPNVEFNTPAYDSSYIKLRIRDDTANRINIGTPGWHRAEGTISIEIYTPMNTGTRVAKNYADTLSALFRDVQFNGITCREANVTTAGEHEGRWRTDVDIPFWWDGVY